MTRLLPFILILTLIAGCSFVGKPMPEMKEIVFTQEKADDQMAVLISPADNPYLVQLREEFSLDDFRGENEMETILAVTDWVHNLWRHDGNNVPDQADPISILRDVQAGARYRCVEYSIVIAGCLTALGIPTRILSLRTEDMETRESGAGHVVCEAFLTDLQQWVLVDGQWNVAVFHNDQPIHAVKLQSVLYQDSDGVTLHTLENTRKDRYRSWIAPYLYFFQYQLDQRYINERSTDWSIMLVPAGEEFPQVFQVVIPIEKVHYTNNLADFYQPPRTTLPMQSE